MVSERLAAVQERMAAAAAAAGRDVSAIRLLAVTKTHPPEVVAQARRAGLGLFGENRVQEAAAKYAEIADEVELHLIGHLQRNKARMVPGLFSWVESIDAIRTARALSHQCGESGTEISVLLELNSSGEASKYGYDEEERLLDESDEIAALPGLHLRGLMTIGPFVADQAAVSKAFARTRALFERLASRHAGSDRARVDTLSMGMTNDYEIAIREGSTEIRVGSALFGARESWA